MLRFRAARAAAVAVLLGALAPAAAAEFLPLDTAFERVIAAHPELAVLRYTRAALEAEAETAGQQPALTAGLSAENVLGTGDAAGVNGLELTVSLASVLERGGKRQARLAVAGRALDGLAAVREAKRLDLLAEVARRYLDAAAAAAQASIAAEDLARRKRTLAAAKERVAAGGAPQSVRLAAAAARARAAGSLARTERSAALARVRLSVLWGEPSPAFEVAALPQQLPTLVGLEDRLDRLQQSPELQAFATEERLREARVQLARSASKPDLAWEVGVRRLEAEDDWAMVGSVSLPLGAATRAAPGIRAADAELAALSLEREAKALQLTSTLAQAQGQLEASVAEANQLTDELLPLLEEAEAAAERAYRAGAVGYLEWAALQDDITDARRQRLAAAVTAHRAFIELQRLTGESLSAEEISHAIR